jgi:O-antigen/teichoic acid export membrane protein
MLPLCLGLAAIAPALIPFIFGADFADAAPVASILLIALAFSSLGGTTLQLILSLGKTRILLISNAVGLAGVIVLGFALIPSYGLMGAAWSRGIVMVLVIAIEIVCAAVQLGFHFPYRALAVIALAAVAQGAAAYAIVLNVGGATSLVIAIPAAVITYLAVLRLFGAMRLVDPELASRLISRAPARVRPLASLILGPLSPPTTERAEQD